MSSVPHRDNVPNPSYHTTGACVSCDPSTRRMYAVSQFSN
jgi:hypothetical protein